MALGERFKFRELFFGDEVGGKFDRFSCHAFYYGACYSAFNWDGCSRINRLEGRRRRLHLLRRKRL
jgi:hypothetical protein